MKIKLIILIIMILNISCVFGALSDSQKAYYKEDINLSFEDNTGHGYDATINGATFTTLGKINGAYDFNGINTYVNVGTFGGYNTANGFTMAVWVKLKTVDNDKAIIGFDNGANDCMIATKWSSANVIYYRCGSTPNGYTYTLQPDTWYHLAITVSGSTFISYLNGVNVSTTSSSGFPTISRGEIGRYTFGGSYVNGTIDEVGIWNKSLSPSEMLQLYNDGTGFQYPYSNTILNLNITNPLTNYTHYNNINGLNITYNVNATNLINCTLYINNTLTQTTNNINTTINSNQYFNYNSTDNDYVGYVTCNDNSLYTNSSLFYFSLDRTTPVWTIRTINTANTTIIDREQTPWIYINDTITDTNLFAYNLSVYYPNGTIWFYNDTFNTTQTQINITRNQTITTTQPNGTYTINYYAEDDHTALEIPIYTTKPIESGISFDTKTSIINITTTKTDYTSIETIKTTDRYSFDFTFKTATNSKNYTLKTDKKIYDRSKFYTYPSFVVGKNWIDFNTDGATSYTTKKISENEYLITVNFGKLVSEITVKSLGGLNIVNQTYTFEIKVNNVPIIQNITPTTNITTTENSYLNFTTYATDSDNDTISYTYNYDNILVYTGQNLTNYYINYSQSGQHTMTVYATDGGKTSNYTWTINVTNVNLPPTITSMGYTPTTWYANLNNTYITCTGYDTDNETNQTNLNYEIGYNTGGAWTTLTPTYSGGNTWTALVNVTTLQDETLNARCRISDGIDTTAYSYLNSFITVQPEYNAPSDTNIIKPNSGTYDFVIPITCTPTTYGTVNSNKYIYDFEYKINGVWYNLSNNYFNKALFDMSQINYTQNVSFRCAINDGITTTAYTETNTITRQHITNLFMFSKGNDEVQRANQIYYKGLYADFNNEAGITIISSYIDCNGDDFWDYYYNYNDTRNTTTENFACYNTKGLVKHTVGVFINKSDANNRFCGVGTLGICKIQRSYDVLVK